MADTARALAHEIGGFYLGRCGKEHCAQCDGATAQIERALRAARNETLESAAKMADGVAEEWGETAQLHQGKEGSNEMEQFDRCNARAMTALSLAEGIRALKDREHG